jgi:hypothetical protein
MEDIFDMTWIAQPHNNPVFAHLVSLVPALNTQTGPWIAGGSARKLKQNLPFETGDVDVFFANDAQRLAWTHQFESTLSYDHTQPSRTHSVDVIFSSHLITYDTITPTPCYRTERPYCYKKLETDNADTYCVHFEFGGKIYDLDMQLIKTRYSPTLINLWRDFDFTISCFAADAERVYHTEQAVCDLDRNLIVLNNAGLKRNLALRVIKHHIYGFEVPPELLIQASQLIAHGEYEWNEIY